VRETSPDEAAKHDTAATKHKQAAEEWKTASMEDQDKLSREARTASTIAHGLKGPKPIRRQL
jgi:hypothetical protein